MSDIDMPDGWTEVAFERDDGLRGVWATEENGVTVYASESVDSNDVVTYPVVVEQHVEHDGYEADIETNSRVESTPEAAIEAAKEFMRVYNDGGLGVHVLGVEHWREYYQFYCIDNGELPDGLTADMLIDSIDNDMDFDDDIDEETEIDDADMVVEVSIYPRHETEVSKQ